MMFFSIWFKHLLSRLATTFFFILISIFSIYVLVDLSVNSVRFFSTTTTDYWQIFLYYLRNFAKHLELFFPLSLLLSSIKVLYDLNAHRELIALQMAGLSKKKLLAPFFLFASFLAIACYCNSEWIAPQAQDEATAFRMAHAKKKKKMKQDVFSLPLLDESELVYRKFEEKKNRFFDVFWIRTPNEIWHMKYLDLNGPLPVARYTDHFLRNAQKLFEKKESYEEKTFSEIRWDSNTSLHRFIPFENRSLSTLFQQLRSDSAERKSLSAHLHYKLALPLLSLLVLFAAAPFPLRFSRSLPIFLFAACALFCFIALATILDGMLILAETQVLSAAIAIWIPLLLSFAAALRCFVKI